MPPVQGQCLIKIAISVDFEVTSSKTFIDKCIYVHPSYSRKNKGSREISLKITEHINQVWMKTHSPPPVKRRGPSRWGKKRLHTGRGVEITPSLIWPLLPWPTSKMVHNLSVLRGLIYKTKATHLNNTSSLLTNPAVPHIYVHWMGREIIILLFKVIVNKHDYTFPLCSPDGHKGD